MSEPGPGTSPASDPLAAFEYALPADAVAAHPPEVRDGGRLLDLTGPRAHDRRVVDFADFLSAGDVLVVNDTRVLHARIAATRSTGGRVELMLLGRGDGATVEAMARPARRLKPGEELRLHHSDGSLAPGYTARIVERGAGGTVRVILQPSPECVMNALGEVPLPPYLRRAAVPDDRVRYQTVFANEAGAVAAPTAGLHLSEELLARVQQKGVEVAPVTLHVGAGTFRNLRPEDVERGTLHPEFWRVPPSTAEAIARCRVRGGRVVAVGTTCTRTLESAADADGVVHAGEGTTRLFIQPGYRFTVVDLLWTNLHLPRSSLLMLVCAFGGTGRVMAAYRHAVAKGYRFFSYGDAMLVSPSVDAKRLPVG